MEKKITSLKLHRIAVGLSQAQLASLVGTYQTHISRIERGRISPVPEEVEKIAAVLNVPPRNLFREMPESPPLSCISEQLGRWKGNALCAVYGGRAYTAEVERITKQVEASIYRVLYNHTRLSR